MVEPSIDAADVVMRGGTVAKGDLYVPERVRADMRERMESRIVKTISEFESASEDEDVLTGHLGANLTTHARQVYVPSPELPGYWTWSLRHRKFRGRGPGATEKKLGADGVIELTLDSPSGSRSKSMLFQSKMEGSSGARGLVEQCAKLSTWREAAAVFSYGKHGFQALTLDATLAAKGDLVRAKGAALSEFLAETFVGCEVGDTELRYHVEEKMLTWIDAERRRVAARFAVKHRIKINVKPPSPARSALQGFDEISADEIAKHRMAVDDKDLLGVEWNATQTEMKAAQKAITKVYHPDMWNGWSDVIREAMEARTKEVQGIILKKRER